MKARWMFLLFVVTGCATEQAMMRHPQTGEIVQCGPGGPSQGAAEQTTHECIHYYREQGYVKVR